VEETNILRRYSPLVLLFIPPLLNVYRFYAQWQIFWSLFFLLYAGYYLVHILVPKQRQLRKAVSGLIAGIALVDFLAASQAVDNAKFLIFIAGCFALALILQRSIPAT